MSQLLRAAVHFDLVVIGGGSGGLAAAKEAAKLNPAKKVLCLNHVKPSYHGTKWGLGGTCVNVGCIPKKLMHHAGNIGTTMSKDAGQFGWSNIQNTKHDWPTMQGLIGDYIHSLNFAYGVGLRSAGVSYVEARAKFDSPSSLTYVTNSQQSTPVTFDRAIVATGGRPIIPQIPGAQLAITSDDLFWLKKSPGKTLVIGGGYIALECAGFLHNLGLDVTTMVRGKVLRKMDQQSAEMVAELMERDGHRFVRAIPLSLRAVCDVVLPSNSVTHPLYPQYRSIEADPKGNARWVEPATGVVQTVHNKPIGLVTYAAYQPNAKIEVTYSSSEPTQASATVSKEEFDTVVFAIGRTPSVEDLGLDAATVRTVEDGKILTDDADDTSNPRIFAIGDVSSGVHVERPELTPAAIKAGQLLARRLWTSNETLSGASNNRSSLMNYNLIPTSVFSSPVEYSYVGLSEEQARLPVSQGGIGSENVEVYWSRFGSLEISPLHPVLPAQRSHVFTGRNQWAYKYMLKHKLAYPELQYDPSGLTSNVVYTKDGSSVNAMVTEKEPQADGSTLYTLRIMDGPNKDAVIKGVPPEQLELQSHVATENAELFYKANSLAKLIVDKSNNERVVGLHFVGVQAGEIVQGFSLALLTGATKSDFDRLVGIHPTTAEEFAVLTVKQSDGNTFLKQAGCGGGSCG